MVVANELAGGVRALSVVMALLVVGCSDSSSSVSSDPSDANSRDSVASSGGWEFDAELTYDLYFANPLLDATGHVRAYGVAFARFSDEVVATCMADRGFDYVSPDPQVIEAEVSSSFETPTRTEVAEEGYGLSIGAETPEIGFDEPPPGYTDALAGDAGCEAEGLELQRGFDSVANRYSSTLMELWEEHESSDVVSNADRRWVTCMGNAGYEFRYPTEAEDSLSAEYAMLPDDDDAQQEFAERERAVALADFDCSAPSRPALDAALSELWQRFEDAHRSQIIGEMESAYEAYEG